MVSLDSWRSTSVAAVMTGHRPLDPAPRKPAGDRVASTEQPGPNGRCCVVCGFSLTGRRAGARHCSAPCRADAVRLRAGLSGSLTKPYLSVADWTEFAQKRAQRVRGPV